MKNVSSAFREELKKDNRNYIKSADITLKNGTVLEIDNSDLWQNGMKLDTATSSSNSFDLGAIITGQLTLTLNNIDEKFSDYDFTDCTATNVKVGLKLPDGTTESLSYGKFYLNEAKYNGSIITLTFYDSIYKFDRPYSKSSLSYPATLRQIVQDACSVCGVTLGTVTFDQDDFVVQERPDDSSITFRQVLQWVGQIACYYFYADSQGRLSMKWYDLSAFEDADNIFLEDSDGNFVLDAQEDKIFTFVENGVIYPGTTMPHHNLASFVSLNTGLDDVVITGIKVIQEVDGESGGKEEISYQSGNDGYVLTVSKNKLIQGDSGSTIASLIGTKIIGMRFRTFSASGLSDPTIEAGDPVVLIDRKGNSYQSYITNNVFQPGAYQSTSLGAETPARKSATRYSQMSQVYVDYRKEIEKERTDREKALEELGERINDSSGLFTTIEKQPDGSKKYFLHNKPILSESDIVWSMTAEAWGVSTDGGKTQNAGMTVDGDTIVRILTAVGINADWINTGALTIEKNGQVMFKADVDTGQVDIVANSFSLRGQTIDEIAQGEVNEFVNGVYAPTLNEIQTQIDQKTETWYQPTDPSLQWKESAIQDTTGADILDTNGEQIIGILEIGKTVHEGDLWKNSDTNVEYIYQDGQWIEMPIPDAVFDIIDGKAQIFVSTPTPPYAIGDLWFNSATSDIMTCIQKRESGTYNAADWEKRNKYTDDTYAETVEENLNIFSEAVTGNLNNMQEQIDGKIETWYYNYQPTLTNIPASQWTTEEERHRHIGDLFYWQDKGFTYRFQQGSNGYIWQAIQDSDITEALEQAAQAQDTADRKRQVFYSTPYPPYDVGDLWAQGANGDIMRCRTARQSGNYVSTDWEKASKYTDDSALDEFINGEFSNTISDLQEQADKKAETWYQSTDPSTSWTTTAIKNEHVGDIWYNTSSSVQKSYRWNGTSWQEMKTTPPDEVFDSIDGKAQIFISRPTPPYAIGDLWFDSATSDIMTCINGRESGSYTSSDWQKRNKYTDDSYAEEVAGDLSNFADQVVGDLENMQTQIDGKIETYYYDYQPTLTNVPASAWTTEEERQKHIGDLFYYKSTGFTYRFLKDGSTWKWQPIKDEDISKALSDAAEAQDTADSKRRVFTSTPTPPYDVGDLWAQGGSGDIMRCIRSRSSGNYTSSDWDKASKYTDDTAVGDLDNALDQEGVFNRLTNNGQTQGIYLKNNRIYINATYIQSGTLSANLIKGGILTLGGASNGNGRLEVLNPSNQVIGTINNTGVNFTGVFQNRIGQEFIKMDESILKGGYGSTVHGRIDLSAQYSDGSYRTVVEALSGSLILKSINGAVEIVQTDGAKDIRIGYAVGSIDGNVSTRIKTMYITKTVSDYYVGFINTQNTVRFAVLTTSDAKLKKNIKDTKVTALDYINQIQHKSFDLKEGDGHKDCGYIAQDLQKIYPGFVVEAPEYNNDGEKTGGTLQVNTFAMLPYMTKAIQELSEENRKLKEEIKEIKKMIKSIGGQ